MGETGGELAVVARLSSGTQDETFNPLPAREAADRGDAVAVLPDHRLRIAGKDGVNAVVVGLLSDGRLDTGFDGDGIATLPSGEAFALAADAAGNLAVAGETTAGNAFLVPVAAGGTVGSLSNLGAGRGVDVAWPAGGPVVLRQAGADSIVDGGARSPTSRSPASGPEGCSRTPAGCGWPEPS